MPSPLSVNVGVNGILPACVDTFHEKGAAVFVSVVGLWLLAANSSKASPTLVLTNVVGV